MMSENHFWNWAALGVTPLTVGKNLPTNRRKGHHRRNDIVLLNINDYITSTGSSISTTVNCLTTTVATTTVNESMEVQLYNRYRYNYLQPRCGDTDIDDRHDVNDSRTSRTQPETTFVFEADYDDEVDQIDQLAGFRLSLAGLKSQSRALSHCQSSKSSDDRRDELHSNLYSSVLDTVRATLVECIPQVTEEMISRAIINAFASDSNASDHRNHFHDSFESDDMMITHYNDRYQNEVDTLHKAYDFMQGRSQFGKRKKVEEFLQTILDETFLKIRREEITSSEEVLRTMLSVLSILQVNIDNNAVCLPMDTILLHGLPENISRSDVQQQLSRFGTIKAVAIAKGNSAFGYCCYVDETSVKQAMTTKDTITIHGVNPMISILHGHNTAKVSSYVQVLDGSTVNCKKSGRLLWSI